MWVCDAKTHIARQVKRFIRYFEWYSNISFKTINIRHSYFKCILRLLKWWTIEVFEGKLSIMSKGITIPSIKEEESLKKSLPSKQNLFEEGEHPLK